MKNLLILSLLSLIIFTACGSDDDNNSNDNLNINKQILYLQVNYEDNAFMGGIITESSNASVLDTYIEYQDPGDFGYLKVFETNTDLALFDGEIDWMGIGERIIPDTIVDASEFDFVLTEDFLLLNNEEEIWTYQGMENNVEPAWSSIQGLELVRAKFEKRSSTRVHYFLYTPTVGDVNEEEAYWVFLIK